MKRNWASELRAIAEGRLMLNVRNGVTVSRSMLAMIADELDAERAAHAETKRELADYQRATNTFDAHETANVSDKPEGAQPVAWRWKPKDSAAWIYDPKHEWLEAQSRDEIDAEPLFTRPSEQAVTNEMVETEMVRMTVSETIRAMGGNPDEQIIGELTVFDAVAVKVRSALKAAMGAGG